MSRTHRTDPDPRFPFPDTPAPTRCRTRPELFDLASGDLSGDTKEAAQMRLVQARRACTSCPVVTECLRWALVNKPVTKDGVFAGTTPGQRNALRRRLADRLGPDWIDVLAVQDQARRERAEANRHTPLTVPQARIVRLDRELNGPLRLLPPLTPDQQRLNRTRLEAGLKAA
ncbi:WhiB family transcriptional regulator [Streptomyces gardneri]|uniref:WhiB family transcriptional regulator n=1 Tax=Streptomyces gardneri TaxID=66892 RepID=UPI0037D0E128